MQCKILGNWDDPVSPRASECAIRFSYAQSVLSALYVSSTGGMFLIGFALRMGFSDAQIGLVSMVPMFCVLAQLISSRLTDRGFSRRRLTIASALASASCWGLVLLMPSLLGDSSARLRVAGLAGALGIITVFQQMANNARSSWLADLVPSDRRGGFFGRTTMYAGLVATVITIGGGMFLDRVGSGTGPFLWVFGFGMLCAGLNAMLFVPQPDLPASRDPMEAGLLGQLKEVLHNRPFMLVTAYAVAWMLQTVAAPFYAAYMLRDLGMSFLGYSAVTTIASVLMLISSPVWGRVVDRFGCRPVLVVCTALSLPLPLVWLWVTTAADAYLAVSAANVLGGIAGGGITVALSTLIYKTIPDSGKGIHLAVYSTAVLLLPAPMPLIGGLMPGWLESAGVSADLRITFFATIPMLLGAVLISRRLREGDALPVSELTSTALVFIRRQTPSREREASLDLIE